MFKGLVEEPKEKIMNKPVVMIIPESNRDVLNEFSDILKDSKNNILVKLMDDIDFNMMFNIECDTLNVDMSDETFMTIAKMAHKNDVTFNNQVVNILKEQLKRNEE